MSDASAFDALIACEQACRRAGVSFDEACMLWIASAAGQVSRDEARRRLALGQARMARVVSRLEDAGCVMRVAAPDDRRRVMVCLLDAGWQRLDELAALFGGEKACGQAFSAAIAQAAGVREASACHGLTPVQERCLRALGQGAAPAAQIARRAGLPRTTAAMALVALERHGLARATEGAVRAHLWERVCQN